MKRLIVLILMVSIFGALFSSTAAADEGPVGMPVASEIGRIYIQTGEKIQTDDYVPCTITVVDPSGEYERIRDTDASIKVRGHSTSGGAKKPYNIKFQEKQDVFGMGAAKKWCLLANMFDKTQMRNRLAYTLAESIGMEYIQNTEYVEVYVNGKYGGLYLLSESIGVGESRVDIHVSENEYLIEKEPFEGYSNECCFETPIYGFLFGYNEPDMPTEAQQTWLMEYLTELESAIASGDYDLVRQYVDVNSFADAYIIQEYFKQVDYITSSTRFYIRDGKLYEGPIWDFDLSSGNCSSEIYDLYNNVETTGNSIHGIHCVGLWNFYLMNYSEFRALVKCRFLELMPYLENLWCDNELGRNQMDLLLEEYESSIGRNNSLWPTDTVYSNFEHQPADGTYEGEIRFLRTWFRQRYEWLYGYFMHGRF